MASRALRHLRWAERALLGPCPCSTGSACPVVLIASEVCFLSQGGHWSGQVPEPACASPSLGALLPCQGSPASGAKRVVPVPWT